METYKDFILEMARMNSAEQFVIAGMVQLVPEVTSIGEVVIKTTAMSNADTNKFIKGVKSLTSKKLLKKLKRSHYMLHPKALPPRDFELAMETWEKL